MSAPPPDSRLLRLFEAEGASADPQALAFAADFVSVAVRALRLGADARQAERRALCRAVETRTGLTHAEVARLLSLALAPEFRADVGAQELRAFEARFGADAAESLRRGQEEELQPEGFARRHGAAEALLLLDTICAVTTTQGSLGPERFALLEGAAAGLGIDPVLASALVRRHDPRQAQGELRFPLQGSRMVIGRGGGAAIRLVDPQVALRHAELVREQGAWWVVDLRSGRPTVVDGRPVARAELGPETRLRIGPYELWRVGEDLCASSARALSALSVRGLSLEVDGVQILDEVSFTVFSGEVVALVGPSGAGKTTLLDAIAGSRRADEGEVLLDDEDLHALLRADPSLVGELSQDDLVLAELSVEEALQASAALRLPPDALPSDVGDEVSRVLEELQLEEIRQRRIGRPGARGLSGGERKRVHLGQELVSRSTRLLFLDEPTSGLDPRASQEIVRLARQLADHGRIVFLVTHDLSPELIALVDHLLVLVPGGRMAWFGPPAEACRAFGVRTPDALFKRLVEEPPEVWAERWRESPAARQYVHTRAHLLGLGQLAREALARVPVALPERRPLGRQLRTLIRRYAAVKIRDRGGLAVLALQPLVLAAVIAVVFPAATATSLFLLSLSATWFGMSGAVRELIADRRLWLRERRVGVGLGPYLGSKVVVLGGLVAVQCGALTLMVHGLLGLGAHGFSILGLSLQTILVGWVGMALGLLVSAAWQSVEAAVGSLPLLLIPQIAFSSALVSLRDMGAVGRLLSALTPQRYAFDALLRQGRTTAERTLGGSFDAQPVSGALWQLGLADLTGGTGLAAWELDLVLVAFAGGFLGMAAVLLARRR